MTRVYMWISRWILWIICGFTQKKRQTVQKWCIIAKEWMWTNHKSSTEPVNEKVLRVQSMKLRQHEVKAERNGD